MSDDISKANPMNNILVLALVVAAFAIGILYTKVQTLEKAGKEQAAATPAAQAQVAADQPQEPEGPATEAITVAGVTSFSQKANAEICKENGKPVAYLFSTEWCPHCEWIKETFDRVAKEYVAAGKIAAHHWELSDMQQKPLNDDTLTPVKESAVPQADMAVYREFNPGGSIPTFVFGCKYFRIGNGFEQQQDLAAEEKEFRALFDELAKN